MKKKIQASILLLAAALLGYSASLRAEDVDIYVDNAANSGAPNVLLIFDNGANNSAAIPNGGCAHYANSTEVPSLGTNTGAGVVQCGLVDAINSLPDGAMNIGLMLTNGQGLANTSPSTGIAKHDLCTSDVGGCLVQRLRLMTGTNKADMVNFIKSWSYSSTSDASHFNVKVNSALQGTVMQEAWAYFNGKVGMSGTNYGTSLLQSGCQRNFIIYIANTEKTPASNENPSPYDGPQGLTSGQAGAIVPDQTRKITDPVYFQAPTCKVSQMQAQNNTNDWSSNWADEWARLMFQQDRGLTIQDGTQNIVTYTIGVTNDATCTPQMPALLSSMATFGGGKFFKVSNMADMTTALGTALNEVQAVNSVFSSASLPVSVNAEGSYLNQIFLGMFRPDSSASPRWMGNLKQYQLIRGQNGTLVMGDAKGSPAISSSGTGFITPTAQSFWTYRDDNAAPDMPYTDTTTGITEGGFFRKDKKGTPASGYDLADGEVVEKGGVAQQLRKENLKADYTQSAGSTGNPRRLYVYCPGGADQSGCVGDLTDASNQFSANNSNIPANAFGTSSSLGISSIVRTGTSATVTTFGNHGFSNGSTVVITNVNESDYNGQWTVSGASGNTFTISPLQDLPPTTTTGTFNVASGTTGSTVSVASIARTWSSTGSNSTETVTVTTTAPHVFTSTSNITIQGATPGDYNYIGTTATTPGTTTLQFPITLRPVPNASGYTVNLSASANAPIPSTTLTNPSANTINGNTGSIAHKLHVGQVITVSGASGGNGSKYPGRYRVTAVSGSYLFTATWVDNGNGPSGKPSETATISADTSGQTGISVARTGSKDTATATLSGLPTNFFGAASGDTAIVNITKSGVGSSESAYLAGGGNVTITCANSGCTQATYSITVSPSVDATGTMTVALSGLTTGTITSITRSGSTATATVTYSGATTFATGMQVSIAQALNPKAEEAAYTGTYTVTCATSACTTFSYGPITLTPATPATGVNMQVYSASTPPNRDTVINWVRGENNQGDEKKPQPDITVRPSIHGDVLHSRPIVINYGDTRGIVAFYGANDGIFRAVNANQSAATSFNGKSVPAGGEIWGLLLQEHYPYYNRLRLNSPELKFPSTILSTAQRKNYFIDGPTGVFQELKADGTINKAYLYLTMRRGGRFMYAVDVTDPGKPTILWRRSNLDTGFEELGQTWSRPRLTLLQNVTGPVLVFGAGYDPAQDAEPPGSNSMGRGVFVISATTGDLIWRAQPSCPASAVTAATATSSVPANCLAVPGMTYPIPSDVTFMDRDLNGKTDKIYVGDTGGNLWRLDVGTTTPTGWTATRLAALGCATGACASGTTPRKFFFPPSILSVRAAGATGSYEAISMASGDREHPLMDTANSASAYNTADMFFMIKDTGTAVSTPATSNVVLSDLVNAKSGTTTTWDGSGGGFYIPFATGEKAVNAPLAVNGQIFFSTNQPIPRDQTCVANLGQARAYAVSPFDARSASNVLQGGGLPPSPVSGLIMITTANSDGTTTTGLEKFCIGCGLSGLPDGTAQPPCNTALENCNVGKNIPKNLKRTYWYKK